MPVSNPDGTLHVAVAGNGNPYSILTAERLDLIRAIHTPSTLSVLAQRVDRKKGGIRDDLAVLASIGLVDREGDIYSPAFLILPEADVFRANEHARVMGGSLAKVLVDQWVDLESTFSQLSVARSASLRDHGFLLVGDRILDVGLLDALAADGELMPPAPARPAPDDPDARYYAWMIEGGVDMLGRYGQRSTPLAWDGWCHLTFGQYTVAGRVNQDRERASDALGTALNEHPATPEDLARLLNVPAFTTDDTRIWAALAKRVCADLVATFHRERHSLSDLYATVQPSHGGPGGFGEFFCWYDHVAYAHAIDALVDRGLIVMPSSHFTTAIWPETESAF